MQQPDTTGIYEEDPAFSLSGQFGTWATELKAVFRHWRKLCIAGIAGGLLGLGYAAIKPVTYTAVLSFVMEDTKASGSLMSALSGSLGLDLGSLAGGTNGMLAGDNIQALVKSRTLEKNTLLTPYHDTGFYSLADKYAEMYHLQEKWQKSPKIGRLVSFPCNAALSRLEDSLLHVIILHISEKELALAKPDKKLNIFELQIASPDERWSLLFAERILKSTTDFYINTKTARLKNNVDRLQHRADSIAVLLNHKTYAASESDQALLDANPAYAGPVAGAEISSREKLILSTVYAEIVKNLEISKTALAQETPTMQIIDLPELPLKRNKLHWYMALAVGIALGTCIAAVLVWLLLKKQATTNTNIVVSHKKAAVQ